MAATGISGLSVNDRLGSGRCLRCLGCHCERHDIAVEFAEVTEVIVRPPSCPCQVLDQISGKSELCAAGKNGKACRSIATSTNLVQPSSRTSLNSTLGGTTAKTRWKHRSKHRVEGRQVRSYQPRVRHLSITLWLRDAGWRWPPGCC